MSLGCAGLARNPAKVEDQVQFLAGALRKISRRWSQTVRRLPAKQHEVGSTPTGVSAFHFAIVELPGIPLTFQWRKFLEIS